MKLTKEQMLNRINDLELDDEIKIAFMEDVSDSMDGENAVDETIVEGLKRDYEDLKWKYEDLLARYKDRFLNGEPEEDVKDPDIEEEFKDEEVIDINEI